MPGLLDHITFLSQEVGPRPAGTEEEQQAALYITEQMQKEAGLSAVIEDFNSESNEETPMAFCSLVIVLFTVVALFFPVMEIPSLVATTLAALIFLLEAFKKPVISKMLARGVSQNVVAKYEPGYSPEVGRSRRRKIVLVAHYDSGKVRPELNSFLLNVFSVLQKVILVAVVFVPVFLLVRYLFFLHADGVIAIVLNVITGVALVLVAIPLLFAVIHRFSPYNEAANCNASGVAVMLEVARRIGREQASNSGSLLTHEGAATIYGAEAARSAGLVPEGAKLVYEATQIQAPELIPQTDAERLVAAKAAIAALTGKPISPKPPSSIADSLVQVRKSPIDMPSDQEIAEQQIETRGVLTNTSPQTLQSVQERAFVAEENIPAGQENLAFQNQSLNQGQRQGQELAGQMLEGTLTNLSEEVLSDAYVSPSEPTVPDWFRKAQESAKKPQGSKTTIKRSQYADALDAAMTESSSHFKKASNVVSVETEERLRRIRDGILEVSTPYLARENFDAQGQRLPGRTDQQETGLSQDWVAGQTQFASGMQFDGQPEAQFEAQSGAQGGAQLWSQQRAQEGGGQTSSEAFGIKVAKEGISDGTLSMPPINVDELRTERPPIMLPNITANIPNPTPLSETSKQQRAPLAVAGESSQTTAKSLLNMLPSIGIEDFSPGKDGVQESLNGQQSLPRPDLKNTIPSLSGAIKAQKEQAADQEAEKNIAQTGGTGSVSTAGSFAVVGATGAFAPVGDELLENLHPDDVYVEDVDDSAYDNSVTETGAFAGPGYVDMPKSRTRKFFDRFRRNKDEEEVSAQQWLDVDEDFDAQSAGSARGGWESFQQTSGAQDKNVSYGSADGSDSYQNSYGEYEEKSGNRKGKSRKESWEGGAFSRRRVDSEEGILDYFNDSAAQEIALSGRMDELQQIQHFHSANFDTEVWFVALGSELSNNGGMRAFLAEHGQDLRGSIIISLNALGSGELSYLEKEGFGKAGTSSRMKRYVTKASQIVGIPVSAAALEWKESAASIASKRGLQAISIVGMNGLKPSRYAQGDDTLENIEQETLQTNTDFVMELIKNI